MFGRLIEQVNQAKHFIGAEVGRLKEVLSCARSGTCSFAQYSSGETPARSQPNSSSCRSGCARTSSARASAVSRLSLRSQSCCRASRSKSGIRSSASLTASRPGSSFSSPRSATASQSVLARIVRACRPCPCRPPRAAYAIAREFQETGPLGGVGTRDSAGGARRRPSAPAGPVRRCSRRVATECGPFRRSASGCSTQSVPFSVHFGSSSSRRARTRSEAIRNSHGSPTAVSRPFARPCPRSWAIEDAHNGPPTSSSSSVVGIFRC